MLHLQPLKHLSVVLLGVVSTLMLIAGCAFDGASSKALQGVKNPFRGAADSDFFALVREHCSAYTVGDQSLGTRLAGDGELRALTEKLYRGDLSNDEYVNMLLQQYPADDANIPATGCVINQMTACLSSRCQPNSGETSELAQADATIAAEQVEAASTLPAAERDAVDSMIDRADAEAASDLGSEP